MCFGSCKVYSQEGYWLSDEHSDQEQVAKENKVICMKPLQNNIKNYSASKGKDEKREKVRKMSTIEAAE